MTESEWLECNDIVKLMDSLQYKASERTFQLFACACCRTVWDFLLDERSRTAIELTEGFVDGDVDENAMRVAASAAKDAASDLELEADEPPALAARDIGKFHVVYAYAAWHATTANDFMEACYVTEFMADMPSGSGQALLAKLLRDVIGNPFCPSSINPAMLTPTVTSLAQAAYEERILPSGELAPARLAVLSDALEEAGCADAEILDHLRGPGPHVRGCWVLDLLLGKG